MFPRSPLQLPDTLTPRWVKRSGDLDLSHFDLESGVRVTCDVGYLCADFSLHSLHSVLDLGSMYATDRGQTSDRQTDVRQHHRLMPPPIRGGDIIIDAICGTQCVCTAGYWNINIHYVWINLGCDDPVKISSSRGGLTVIFRSYGSGSANVHRGDRQTDRQVVL